LVFMNTSLRAFILCAEPANVNAGLDILMLSVLAQSKIRPV